MIRTHFDTPIRAFCVDFVGECLYGALHRVLVE
jgi:hypothetical protein